jgi:hypothetical protein
MEMGTNTSYRKGGNGVNKKTYKYDKQIINVNGSINNQQINTSIYTATYPCVFMGLQVHGGTNTLAALLQGFQWFVHLVEQGTPVPNIAYGGSAFQPEQNVIANGAGMIATSGNYFIQVRPKTGRKLRAGDQIYFSIATNVGQVMNYMFNIQFFLRI